MGHDQLRGIAYHAVHSHCPELFCVCMDCLRGLPVCAWTPCVCRIAPPLQHRNREFRIKVSYLEIYNEVPQARTGCIHALLNRPLHPCIPHSHVAMQMNRVLIRVCSK